MNDAVLEQDKESVKIKEWKYLLPKEKANITFMTRLAKLYKKHKANAELDPDYIKILGHVDKLKFEAAKEQERVTREAVKEQERVAKEQERLAKEQGRLAREAAKEQERLAKAQERVAKEQERLAREATKEQERLTKEQERLAREATKEQERLAKEKERQVKAEEKKIKEIEKEAALIEKKNEVSQKVEMSRLTLQEIINKYNFHQVQKGNKLTWYFQRDVADEFGNRVWDNVGREVLKARHYPLSLYIPGGQGSPSYSAMMSLASF